MENWCDVCKFKDTEVCKNIKIEKTDNVEPGCYLSSEPLKEKYIAKPFPHCNGCIYDDLSLTYCYLNGTKMSNCGGYKGKQNTTTTYYPYYTPGYTEYTKKDLKTRINKFEKFILENS